MRNNFTEFEKLLQNYLVPLIERSMAAHPCQGVVWLRLHTAVDQFYDLYRGLYTETITMYNEAIQRILK